VDARMMNSYLRSKPTRSTGKRHPLLAGLEDAGASSTASRVVHTQEIAAELSQSAAHADSVLPRPAHGRSLSAPAERPTFRKSSCGEAGKGRVVYFPWDIDRIFWEVLAVDHFKLLRNAVDWAANEPHP
jgi:hypothetical protein